MGVLASISFVCIFIAYSSYSPSVVSLFEYLIIWSVIIGFIYFNDTPDFRTFLGIILIIGAGTYIYFRKIKKTKSNFEFT